MVALIRPERESPLVGQQPIHVRVGGQADLALQVSRPQACQGIAIEVEIAMPVVDQVNGLSIEKDPIGGRIQHLRVNNFGRDTPVPEQLGKSAHFRIEILRLRLFIDNGYRSRLVLPAICKAEHFLRKGLQQAPGQLRCE